jgi:hypothetical protein
MARRSAAAVLMGLLVVGPAFAQAPVEPSVFPPPDPQSWWDEARPRIPEAADPMAGRRLRRGERATPIDNGVEPNAYRLWGLQPLQTQLLRGDEMILEVWVRPALTVRQTVIRIVVRQDGEAFVQARAGEACCDADIGRRVGFDAKLPAGAAQALRALRDDPLWRAPRGVRVEEGGGATEAVCVDGVAYDLTLMTPGRAVSVRRACDPAAIGEAAAPLVAAIGAALGHEPRIDVLFPKGADFSAARADHARLIAEGGRLKPDPDARPQAPAVEIPPEPARPSSPPPTSPGSPP